VSDLLPHVNELPAPIMRRVAELHHDEALRAVLVAAGRKINTALRVRDDVSLYRAQGAAALLDELETLLQHANDALLRR
jgi:hypothetical protein